MFRVPRCWRLVTLDAELRHAGGPPEDVGGHALDGAAVAEPHVAHRHAAAVLLQLQHAVSSRNTGPIVTLMSSRSLANTSMSSLNHCTEGLGVPSTFTRNSTFSCSRAMVSFSMRTK